MPGLQQLNCEAHPHLPFAALWYTGTSAINGAIGYALHRSRSDDNKVWQRDRNVRGRGRVQRAVTRETKSRHTVKRDG
jgi:hypothetical protein